MPVAVFAGAMLLLGVVMTLLTFGAPEPAKQKDDAGVAAPLGYSFVYRFVPDDAAVSQSDLPSNWICLGDGVNSPWTSCFAPESGGLTLEQIVSIGTLIVGACSVAVALYVGVRRPPTEKAAV